MNDVTGTVFNIQRSCTNDGPGIRTTVFLKGCPLHCAWCHNPESVSGEKELMYYPQKCIGCGYCASVCPKELHTFNKEGTHNFKRSDCIVCGKCAEKCSAKALEVAGEVRSVREIIDTVMRDKMFYDNSGGGMTISGGEPMLQSNFSTALAEAAKENGLDVCIETCGFCDFEKLAEIAKYTDLFLYDFKIFNEAEHIRYTGASNKTILENLFKLDALGAKLILRCPIIPGINMNEEHFENIKSTVSELKNVCETDFEPYHPIGLEKYKALGKKASYENREFADREAIKKYITDMPVKPVIL